MTTPVQEQSLHKMPQLVPSGMQTDDDGHFECCITSNIYCFKSSNFTRNEFVSPKYHEIKSLAMVMAS